MEWIKNWISQIVTITMLLVLVEIIAPSGKTRKFIRLIAGFVLVITIMNPVAGIIKKGFAFSNVQFRDSMYIKDKEIKNIRQYIAENQMEQIINVYRKTILDKVITLVKENSEVVKVEADMIMNENIKSKKFGEIRRIYLNIYLIKREKDIDKIKIPQISLKRKNNITKHEGVELKIEQDIKLRLKKLLDINEEDIVINILD